MTPELRDWVNEEILPYLPTERVQQVDKLLFRCPICGDSKKSSTKKRGYYYLRTATYHCFNCDVNLTGMKLLQILSGEEYEDIKGKFFKTVFDGKHFNSLSSSVFSSNDQKNGNVLQLKNSLKPEWKSPLSERAREYLKGRMVDRAPFLKEKLFSYFSKGGGEYILIPWKINGIDAYFQLNDFLKLNKRGLKYVFPKNMDKLVYGLDNIDIDFPYLICFEGVYDSLFVPNGLAIGGKNLTELQRNILRKRFPRHKIVYALDNDRPGLIATARTLSNGNSPNVLYFKWFDTSTKVKDINDLVKEREDVNIFKNKKYVESLILDPITMKMWLSNNGYKVENGKDKQSWKKGKIQQRAQWDFHPNPSRKVQGEIQTCI